VAARSWPAEEAQDLYAATLDWATCDATRRRNVEDALWAGFDRLLEGQSYQDREEWDTVRWRPPELVFHGRQCVCVCVYYCRT
jgi:hypothetical protein